MRIDNLKINAFGKLSNKEIKLEKGINIILGENETGKSSIQKFIPSVLYGISKNKNGKEISDFDKYKPWNTEEFSGKINYTLDSGESFEVFREFKKKNPIIYNNLKEDISKKFNIDKTKGVEFFIEQTKIDEETFCNTAITEQEGLRLSKANQNSIVQKMSNLITTGDDNISFQKAIDKISRRQNEEIGTDRTMQRPINLLNKKLSTLMDEKKSLEMYKENVYDNTLRKEQLTYDKNLRETEINFLKEVKEKLDNNRIKKAEINFNKNLENEYNEKIAELNSHISKDLNSDNYEKESYKNYYMVLGILAVIFVILAIVTPFKWISLLLIVPAIAIIYKRYIDHKKHTKGKEIYNSNQERVKSEIEVLNQNREKQKLEASEKEQKLIREIEKIEADLIEKYNQLLDLSYIKENLTKSYDEILKEIEIKEKRLRTVEFELKTIEFSDENTNSKIEQLSKLEEEIQAAESEKEEMLVLNNSYNIAKECMERAYNQVKENVSPDFIQNLCTAINKISNGRYNNVVLSDTEGLQVEIENGSYMPVSRLSIGTIDQMYLSLRLSALNEMSKENMPIILDEVFAYFDDSRLENILKYLKLNFENSQIIIFSCSKREKEALDKLNIEYNLVKI